MIMNTITINVGGEGGFDTSDATAIASDILYNKTAYARGNKLTGTYVDKLVARDTFLDFLETLTGSKPTRSSVISFIDLHTAGTYIIVSIAFSGTTSYVVYSPTGIEVTNGMVTSNSPMWSCDYSESNRSRGTSIDFTGYAPVVEQPATFIY